MVLINTLQLVSSIRYCPVVIKPTADENIKSMLAVALFSDLLILFTFDETQVVMVENIPFLLPFSLVVFGTMLLTTVQVVALAQEVFVAIQFILFHQIIVGHNLLASRADR